MATPEDIAYDFIANRCHEIEASLSIVGVTIEAKHVFENPVPQGGKVEVRHMAATRLGIPVAEKVPNLMYGQVALTVSETYSYEGIGTDSAHPLLLLKYSYQFSYMPELLIIAAHLRDEARNHWGDLLLTQRRIFRFDGEDETGWQQKRQQQNQNRYCNTHSANHFHTGVDDPVRLCLPAKPSVLAVAAFIILSFQYERWRTLAAQNPNVLQATQQILPHVAI